MDIESAKQSNNPWMRYSQITYPKLSPAEKKLRDSLLNECAKSIDHYAKLLGKYPNVTGVGVSLKEKSGEVLNKPCIVVYVSKKISGLKEGVIPAEIEGWPTDVVPVGKITGSSEIPGCPLTLDNPPKHKFAFSGYVCPFRPGYPVAHGVGVGTIGALVTDRSNARPSSLSDILVLSNNHVLANCNDSKVGDCLYHFSIQAGEKPQVIGELERYAELDPNNVNTVDAALFRPSVPFHPSIPHSDPHQTPIGIPVGNRPLSQSDLGQTLAQKTGARTGTTFGIVSDIRHQPISIALPHDPGFKSFNFVDLIVIRGAPELPFSCKGDSGSLVLDFDSRAIGLFFADNSVIDPNNPTNVPISVCCNIQSVLNHRSINADLVDRSYFNI